jgi:3-hydroxy-9,10-secoandrosta-1,3,5(10)-triene-9,17-dione monooxygenase reductase component
MSATETAARERTEAVWDRAISPASVDRETFRAAMRRMASPVAVVTAVGADGARGMTISSLVSVSLDPPLVAFAVDCSAQMHAALEAADGFAIHVAGAHQARLCDRFAEPGRSGREQFAGALYGFDADGNPVLGGVLAVLRCRVHQRVPAGDHTLVLGRVVEVRQHEGGAPLLRYDGTYRSVRGCA